MDRINLEPCPFCEDTIGVGMNIEQCICKQHYWVSVHCYKCGANGPQVILHDCNDKEETTKAEDAAADIWNEKLRKLIGIKYSSLDTCPNCGRKFTDDMVCECGQNNADIRL